MTTVVAGTRETRSSLFNSLTKHFPYLDEVEEILVGNKTQLGLDVSAELIQRSAAVRIDGYDVETV